MYHAFSNQTLILECIHLIDQLAEMIDDDLSPYFQGWRQLSQIHAKVMRQQFEFFHFFEIRQAVLQLFQLLFIELPDVRLLQQVLNRMIVEIE
jgi:hypothetical protein